MLGAKLSGPDRGWAGPAADGARLVNAAGAIAASLLLIVAAAAPSGDGISTTSTTAKTGDLAKAVPAELAIGFYGGAPYHYPSDLTAQKPGSHDFTIRDVAWYTEPFKSPIYYGARIVRWPAASRVGTMIDFLHSKAFAPLDATTGQVGQIGGQPLPETGRIGDLFKRLEFTHGHNMLTFNALFRLASIGPMFHPYVGGGAGISLPHSEVHRAPDNARTYEYQYTGPTAQAVAGIEIRLSRLSLFLEYKFTAASYIAPLTGNDGSWLPLDLWRQFSRWWSGEPPPGGYVSTDLLSHQAVGGFLIRVSGPQPTFGGQ